LRSHDETVSGIPVSGVSELVLEVLDLEEAERFYAAVLGFPVVERWPDRGAVWVMAGDRTRIGLWNPQIGLARGRGGVHVHYAMKIEDADFDRAVGVNLRSGFFATRYALPLFRRSGEGGTIVFTASTAGIVASMTSPLYSMTKHGVVGLVHSLSQVLADEKIRVNAVCPGPVRTPMLPGFMGKGPEETDWVAEHYGGDNALKRVAQPEEIAEAVLFLASERSSYITGVPLPVDAGFLAK
jgi:NAD(P)-dependent dehydrogenase (short-subunit alcohol dehydrogenase family)